MSSFSSNNYILGAGIAGLIWAFYNKDYYVVSPEIGGQMKNNFNLGPRYLHNTSLSKNFLQEISYPIQESTIKVSYIDDNGWVESPDLEWRQKYYMKSRSTNSLDGFDGSVMNSNKSEFGILNVDFDEIIKKLETRIGAHRFIIGSVLKIDDFNKILVIDLGKGAKYYIYNKIISSIPANILNKIVSPKISNNEFQGSDMTYVYTDKFEDIKNFDYVYDLRSTTAYHRITKENDGLVLDYFGNHSKEDSIFDPIRSYIRDIKVLKNAQIISRDDFNSSGNIRMIGRYGTWNRSWKTEKVIEEATK